MASTRRLAAILAADVAGYSRLMRADELGTHTSLMAHRRDFIEPKIGEHHGHIVKNTGDGFLVEFVSVLEAVRCAVEMQRGMLHRNRDVTEVQRISFRIGINLADVIAEPEDIYGDGVNVAARLEALAEPNGICISQVVYEQVRDQLPFEFADLGHRSVKNISRPLHAFGLGPDVIAALPLPETGPPRLPNSALHGRPPRLSIVVLPFGDMSESRGHQYLADAITDDVTTDLSRIPDMVVISRSTAFTYRDKPIDTRWIGRELNVRYVLGGSLRRSGSRVRVNAHLIDAETDRHVWADRFDHDANDLFALQDEVTSRIAIGLDLELVSAEAGRPAAHPDAVDYILRGRAALYRGPGRENIHEAIDCFNAALDLDPRSVHAQVLLADALATRVLDQLSDEPEADLRRAEKLIVEAPSASPSNWLIAFVRGQIRRAQFRYDAAIPEYETAITLNRNSVLALAALGQCRFLTGSIEEAIPAQELAIRLSPRDPHLANWYWRIGMAHLLLSRGEQAIFWLERARSINPRLPGPHAWLASAYALVGDLARAADELSEARRLSGDGRYSSLAYFKRNRLLGSAKTHDLAEATFFTGLRKAGVPDC